MGLKKNLSDLELVGVSPQVLMKHIENTVPFLFSNTTSLSFSSPRERYLKVLINYKKNGKLLKQLNLTQYFELCLCAHWATAGTFVPTDVDNQIRKTLWLHPQAKKNLEVMVNLTLESWTWDYSQMTNRLVLHPALGALSTHEGTWLSVAIGAYAATKKYQRLDLAQKIEEAILKDLEKEQRFILDFSTPGQYYNPLKFLQTTALIAHNCGDLDRVIDQWGISENDLFRKKIYKLGSLLNENFHSSFVLSGSVNKQFMAVENHRHMSMRQPRCLRKSEKFLISIGPFMDEWGYVLGSSQLLNKEDKVEIIAALLEGFFRQNLANGYARAFRGLLIGIAHVNVKEVTQDDDFLEVLNHASQEDLLDALKEISSNLPADLWRDLLDGLNGHAKAEYIRFFAVATLEKKEFENIYETKLLEFECPVSFKKFP